MNSSIIRFVLGYVLKMEAVLMLLPCIVAVLYREQTGFAYLLVAAVSMAFGTLMTIKKPKSHVFYLKEGCVATALSWIFLSFFGALPFWISGEIPSLIDALFETVSGFTTTGSSILADVEALSHCALFWRSFTHWIGGMGVLVFLLAVIPLSGGSHINLMRAESPGPSVGKLVPKIKYTAQILYIIYFGMTIVEIVLLLISRMPAFDAITLSFGTAGTGGFGVYNDSMGSFSPYLQNVVTIFMVLFGINFNFYFFLLVKEVREAFAMEEVRWYLIIFAAATLMIAANLTIVQGGSPFYYLHHSAFQVASVMTTTGFATVDFNLWPNFSRSILVVLMFIGACAGSTGGGMKVSRYIIYFKTLRKELSTLIHPRSVKVIQCDGKAVDHDTIRSANIYLIAYIFIYMLYVLLISFDKFDLTTNFTAVAATFNNIGPGLNVVGPTGNFAGFSMFSKIVLIFDMLAGRLEIFPMLILLAPGTWKK